MSNAAARVPSAVGDWVVEGDEDGLTGIHLARSAPRSRPTGVPRAVARAAHQLSEYFAGRRHEFEVDLHLTGTPFQQDVWLALTAIPYGEVRSYADVAIAVGRPNAFRAVGNANGKNPWPVIVPCHRVVASDGIGGYAIGLDVKRFLLEIEGIDAYN